MTQSPRSGTQSIERALHVLRELATRSRFGWGLSDLALHCGLDKATTRRILACLVRERMARQRAGDHRYLPGPLLFELGLAVPPLEALRITAEPPLARIARRFRGVAALSLASGRHSVYAARRGHVAIKGMSIEVGDRHPLVMTSGGVAMLIAMPRPQAQQIITANLRDIAVQGATRIDALRKMIRRSAASGFGVNEGTTVRGVNGYAVAIPNAAGPTFCALSVAGPAEQFPPALVPEVIRFLREEAKGLEADVARAGHELASEPAESESGHIS